MLKLIQNEIIKVFAKFSTWVMFVIIALFAFGLAFLTKVSIGSADYTMTYDRNYIESEIQYLNSAKPQGYEAEAARMEYMLDSNVTWSEDTWQYDALTEAFEEWKAPVIYGKDELDSQKKDEYEKNFEEIMKPVLSGDWEAYAKKRLEMIEKSGDSEAMKSAEAFYYTYMLDESMTPETMPQWQQQALSDLSDAMRQQAELEDMKSAGSYVSEETEEQIKGDIALYQYILEHKIENYVDSNGYTGSYFWSSLLNGSSVVTIASVMMIVLAGGCVANEFSAGTIKFLLINPVKRSKIIVSKYLMLLIVGLGTIAAVFAVSILSNIILFGPDLNVPYLTVGGGTVHVGSSFWYAFVQYLLNGVNLLAMMTMAFMISSLMRNAAVAIGIGVAALMGGSMLVVMLAQLGCDWGRYIIFANMNLTQIAEGNGFFPNQTLTFSLITLAVYMAVFLMTAFDGFTRREV